MYHALGLNAGRIVAVKRKRFESRGGGNCAVYAGGLPGQAVGAPEYEGTAMDKKTSRNAANGPLNGPLRQTFEEFGKLNEKLVTSYVFRIAEGPDQGLGFLHRSDVHRKIHPLERHTRPGSREPLSPPSTPTPRSSHAQLG